MSDKAARMLLAGMLAIAAAILLGQGIYTATSTATSVASVAVVNKLTGTVTICGASECYVPGNK